MSNLETNSNDDIQKYLKFYFGKKPSSFAILLKGPWGCGKTHFINKVMEDKEFEYIYVSLNGIHDEYSLDKAFLSSVISTKINDFIWYKRFLSWLARIRFVKNIIKYAERIANISYIKKILSSKLMEKIKKTLNSLKDNIKLIPLAKNSLQIGLSAFNINISPKQLIEINKLKPNTVIIFDDLERCSIGISILLGFINFYVENKKIPVVIIANEDEIKDEIKDKNIYKSIKEKVIGKEFLIKNDVKSILDTFLNDSNNEKLKKFISEESIKKDIQNIFEIFQGHNLRLLKMSLQELEIMSEQIDDFLELDTFDFWRKFIQIFMILYLEIKSGNLNKDDFGTPVLISSLIKGTEKCDEKEKINILKKYTSYIIYDLFLPDDFWKNFLYYGKLDKKIIETKLKEFYKKIPEEFLALQDLRSYFKLSSENEFLQALNIVEDNIQKNTYKDPQTIMKIIDVFLELNSKGFTIDKKYLTSTFFITYIQNNNCIKYDELDFENDRFTSSEPFWEKEYFDHKNKEFKNLFNFIQQEKQTYKYKFFEEKAKKIEQEPKQCLKLIDQNSGRGDLNFTYFPIMQYVDTDIFIKNLIMLLSEEIYKILGHIKSRRSYFDSEKNIPFYVEEVKWTDELREKLNKQMEEPNLSTFDKTKLQITVRAIYK